MERGKDIPRDMALERLRKQLDDWEKNEVEGFLSRQPECRQDFRTASGLPMKRVYTALDLADTPLEDIGLPGQYPYTRGPYPTMYRARPWTIRQVAGFGNPADTNRRYKYLIAEGQTGISTDFDMPTLMGYDSDHPLALGEVGREGVAVDTLDDMEALFADIDLSKISVSMTINPSAWIIYAMYVAVAQERGYDLNRIAGTIQADILKEYIAQKEWAFPVRPSVRIMRDIIVYSTAHTKRFNPISISGYHMAEAGATAVQEAAFTMAVLVAYVEEVMKAGVDVDDFAPRLSFFYTSHADFFEEIAKFRALRRVYAKLMKERFGARKPESMRLRFHAQTAAMTLTRPQHKVNLVRTALQALSAVLGGAQSLHTNGLDEAFTIPTEEAMKLAMRTQQVIADETNITSVVDPLGGSYFVESLTTEMEREILGILDQVEAAGGTVKAVEDSWFQRRIADSAYDYELKKADGARTVIGVNKYVEKDEQIDIETHPYDPKTERRQIENLERVRKQRDNGRVSRLLAELEGVARDEDENIMPITLELVKAKASMGEIVETLKGIWGTYRETPVF